MIHALLIQNDQIDEAWRVSLERLGLRISPEQFYDDSTMTYLTNNSIAFAKALLVFTTDTLALIDGPSHALVASSLNDIVAAHRRHVAKAITTTKLKSDVRMHLFFFFFVRNRKELILSRHSS